MPNFFKVSDRYLIRMDCVQSIDVHNKHLKLTMRDGVSFEIDFKDEIMARGFVFKNPNASHTCGCGSSFTA